MDGHKRWYSGVDEADIVDSKNDPLAPCGYCRRCAIHDDPGGCLVVQDYVEQTLVVLDGFSDRYREAWDRNLMTYEELVAARDRHRPEAPEGGLATFESLSARYEFVARKVAVGFNYFVGFRDAEDLTKPYGLSYGFSEGVDVNKLYIKDLHGLIH